MQEGAIEEAIKYYLMATGEVEDDQDMEDYFDTVLVYYLDDLELILKELKAKFVTDYLANWTIYTL